MTRDEKMRRAERLAWLLIGAIAICLGWLLVLFFMVMFA
jgi:uncharacterized membrane protein